MKSIKVNYMGKRLKDIYPHATKWQVFKYRVRRFMIQLMWCGVLALVVAGIFEAGGYANPKSIILPPSQVIKEVEVRANVLDRIAKCESPKGHWENGQVVVRSNTNRSVDIGKYQINNFAWGKKASELGYNLAVEEDNEAMALWIYKNHGTEPWYSSKSCWNK